MQLGTAAGSDWVWRIGIADPHRAGEVLAIIDVVDGAVATSGTAERGVHILDPRSGEPATGVRTPHNPPGTHHSEFTCSPGLRHRAPGSDPSEFLLGCVRDDNVR